MIYLAPCRGDLGDGAAVLHQQGLDVSLELQVLGRAQQVVEQVLRRLRRHLAHAAEELGLRYRHTGLLAAGVIWEGKKDKMTKEMSVEICKIRSVAFVQSR